MWKNLWAPWRLAYVVQDRKTDPGCFICEGLAQQDDRTNLIALRTSHCVVVLNRYPYNNGHLLVAPQAHKASLDQLNADEILDTQRTLSRMLQALQALMKPDGYNIGLNLGRVAGAGLPGHLHWHVVPRWEGDTNFMPVLAEVKVIVQSLEAFYDLLTDYLRKQES
ncbi:MAG: HIT domain-containing protein [Gemmatales bacterium]|nr:HIT domain-containing protein [Gemmatales bacterium]MDW8221545.1 HIT domain-containing protein [Gemmatales bacterium]